MLTQIRNLNNNPHLSQLVKWNLVLIPVLGGCYAQYRYARGATEIYVYLNPPGHISPWMSLEWLWWMILFIGTTTFCYLTLTRRLPRRLFYSVYIYLLFLLVFVKAI